MNSSPLILSISNETPLPEDILERLLSLLPESFGVQIQRFYKWQDRQAALLGKSLLRLGLQRRGAPASMLARLEVDYYSRPALPLPFDFNISHCPGRVVCAFLEPGPVGIDIEPIRPVPRPYDFRSVLTPLELKLLQELPSDARDLLFANIWTRKEAAIKADGKGFSNELTGVSGLGQTVALEGVSWEIHEIPLPGPYICHLAARSRHSILTHQPISLENLFDS